MQPGKTIGLWIDQTSEEEAHWVVSRDTMDEQGQAETTDTVASFDEDDYASAKDAAIVLASQEGMRVIETRRAGQNRQIWPE